ncbi:MAG: hypothetical protein LBM09_00735 [Candidatus Nomurabacteria bacterium]|jgi:hypothetical protein|nr:hypothetical protein [Candidatus Nomurabacteria bacterium]
MNELLHKGNFQPIDENFLTRSLDVFQGVSDIQAEYHKGDTDTFVNEVRDSIAAKYLNFTHINIEKHGFDARRTLPDGAFEFLEVKSASFDSETWSATFNDTNQEKADSFKESNVYLCLSLWRYASEPIFFAFGKNPNIGYFLEDKMLHRPAGTRSTQTISLQNLVNEYGFLIYSIHKNPAQIYQILQMKNNCKKIPLDAIRMISDL